MNIEVRKLKVILILLIVVIISLLSILVLLSQKQNSEYMQLATKAVEGTKWPLEEVPLLVKEGITVKDLGEYTCQANVESGVTYEEVREYLIELYDDGFDPNSDYGSDNPKRLISSIEGTDITEITWIAQKDNYYVTVLWALEGAVNESNIPYEYNFDMNLFMSPSSTNNNQNEVIADELLNEDEEHSGNIESSGEVNFLSGEQSGLN